jgi:hypothetical protein
MNIMKIEPRPANGNSDNSNGEKCAGLSRDGELRCIYRSWKPVELNDGETFPSKKSKRHPAKTAAVAKSEPQVLSINKTELS